jgi:predicted MFS family arabinose efflux permease
MSEFPAPDAAAPVVKKHLPHAFAAFESVPYRWLIGSLLTFFLSMQGQLLVRSLLAWELTHSELSLAWVNLVVAVPMVFGSFLAGALIDRVERRRLVIAAQLAIMANELLVLSLLLAGLLEFWHLLLSSFILGALFPFVMPTRTAMIYGLVGREKLGNAMALQAATMNVARILGPALVGMLIPLISLSGAYVTSISLYLLSTYAMFKLPLSHPEAKSGKSLLKDMTYSFTYVAKHREMLLCLLFGIFPLLLAMPLYSMLVVFAEEVWLVGETGLGMMMATVGIGGITGSLLVARMGEHNRRTLLMMLAALLFALMVAGFSLSMSFALALCLLLLANMFSNISQTLNNTLIQLLAHNEVRGRMSSLMMLSLGLTPLGVLPVALAAERIGIANTMFFGCVILVAVVLALYFLSPTLRGLDSLLAAAHAARTHPADKADA